MGLLGDLFDYVKENPGKVAAAGLGVAAGVAGGILIKKLIDLDRHRQTLLAETQRKLQIAAEKDRAAQKQCVDQLASQWDNFDDVCVAELSQHQNDPNVGDTIRQFLAEVRATYNTLRNIQGQLGFE